MGKLRGCIRRALSGTCGRAIRGNHKIVVPRQILAVSGRFPLNETLTLATFPAVAADVRVDRRIDGQHHAGVVPAMLVLSYHGLSFGSEVCSLAAASGTVGTSRQGVAVIALP